MRGTQYGKNFTKLEKCRACQSGNLTQVIDLGQQALANEFVHHFGQFQHYYPLAVVFCGDCSLLQLSVTVPKEELFKDYVYVSSTASSFVNHFKQLAKHLYSKYEPKDMIDIGSNDGILLKPFQDLGVLALGIEPADKIAHKAIQEGIFTYSGWIDNDEDVELFKAIADIDKVDLITACNVFAHVDDINKFMENVLKLLQPDGVFVIEVAHLLKFVENNYFDTIYHEHFFYWSVFAMQKFFAQHGMEIVDVEEIPTHGGSIRVYVQRSGVNLPSKEVKLLIAKELSMGLADVDTFLQINNKMIFIKDSLTKMLLDLKTKGKRTVAYGAPAKGNTLLNYLQVPAGTIAFIVDDSPYKQNLYSPGCNLAVMHPKILKENEPDCILILAWNYANEIIKNLRDGGYSGDFIVPFPEPKYI